MRPSDPRQQSTSRPNLMSGNRKRSTAGGNILDQLESRSARTKGPASFNIGIEPRWVWAGGGAIVLLVGALASIAWSNTMTAKAQPLVHSAAPPAAKPEFEAGPARVERVSVQSHKAAAVLLAKVEAPPMPPPMPLIVLPKEGTAKVVRSPAAQKPSPAQAAKAKPSAPRQSARRVPSKPQRVKPEPAPQAAQEADPDVALIRAIRKATQGQSE